MRNLAIIPARSGSRGLPDKNVRELRGKPLLAYSIQAARDSGLFARVAVSTDSARYAQVAEKWGASVPFLRPAQLADDRASSWDVVIDVVNRLQALGESFDTIALLQPTSPARTAADIAAGYRLLEERAADSIIAVCRVEHSPASYNVLPADHCLANFLPAEPPTTRRQDLPELYRVNGALYLVRTAHLLAGGELYGPRGYALIMPTSRSIDIDDELDFAVAEALLARPRLS